MIQGRLGIVWGLLRRRGARVRDLGVRKGEQLFVFCRFVRVERPVVIRGALAVVPDGGPVVRHPPEVLRVVIWGPELVGPPPLGIVVVPG